MSTTIITYGPAKMFVNILVMLPSSKKLREHIVFGLCVSPSVRLCVRASVCASVRLCVRASKTVHARVLKFHIWIPHGKIFDAHFFLVRVISLSGVMPL